MKPSLKGCLSTERVHQSQFRSLHSSPLQRFKETRLQINEHQLKHRQLKRDQLKDGDEPSSPGVSWLVSWWSCDVIVMSRNINDTLQTGLQDGSHVPESLSALLMDSVCNITQVTPQVSEAEPAELFAALGQIWSTNDGDAHRSQV